jgi:hypothetical protein
MIRLFRTVLGFGALAAVALVVWHYAPFATRVTLALVGALVFCGLLWIFGRDLPQWIVVAYRDRYPSTPSTTRAYTHWPPWEVPRILAVNGTGGDMEDYLRLQERLTPVPGPIPVAILLNMRDSALRNEYHDTKLYLDRATGQHWIEYGYEVNWYQWIELVPVSLPADHEM